MIIDEIKITNFGVYRGEHSVRLTPPSAAKPVILMGGLNGSGKTTFLDALQLVLYGKMAKCSNRGSMAYEQYLKKCINRDADAAHGAELSLLFSHRTAGKMRQVRVTRRWSFANNSLKEFLEVKTRFEGQLLEVYDPVLSESWNEHVDTFLPTNISPLFFFDGEKIEALADLDKSREILKTAIQGLLGLDLVDRLEGDLEILERQKKLLQKPEEERAEIYTLEASMEHEMKIIERFNIEKAALVNELESAEKILEKCSKEFAEEGGALFEQRDTLEKEKTRLEANLEKLKEAARELSAGVLPLLLLQESFLKIQALDKQEENRENLRLILKVLEERDSSFLASLKDKKFPTDLLMTIKNLQVKDVKMRRVDLSGESVVQLSRPARGLLANLTNGSIDQTKDEVEKVAKEAENTEGNLVILKRKLSAVPTDSSVAVIFKRQETARLSVLQVKSRASALEASIATVKSKIEELKRNRSALLLKKNEENNEASDAERVIKHSARTRETLERFRSVIVEKNVKKIQFHVMESFKKLFRKKSLLIDIRINPSTLEIELIGTQNHIISPERLSAGERQILATSLLWGLARSAGRNLPAVIDTPLGRLDTKHRLHMVERYFPNASHQVILLSTDEEVNHLYYDRLKPFVGHSYTMAFDEDKGTSEIIAGYFGEKL